MSDQDSSISSRGRRRLLAGSLGMFGTAVDADVNANRPSDNAPIEVWIDLGEPLPAGAPNASEADRRRARVSAQQDRVADLVRELGGVELARVRHARNAILVRIAPDQVAALRALPGVVRVRSTRTLHPPKPMP